MDLSFNIALQVPRWIMIVIMLCVFIDMVIRVISVLIKRGDTE